MSRVAKPPRKRGAKRATARKTTPPKRKRYRFKTLTQTFASSVALPAPPPPVEIGTGLSTEERERIAAQMDRLRGPSPYDWFNAPAPGTLQLVDRLPTPTGRARAIALTALEVTLIAAAVALVIWVIGDSIQDYLERTRYAIVPTQWRIP